MLLKKDTFGEIRLERQGATQTIVRDVRPAAPWARWLARRLLAREANALVALDGIRGIPAVVHVDRDTLHREYVDGEPMYVARPQSEAFFREAAKLLRRMHTAGVIHNDLAKEPNILVDANDKPVFIDFQLASYVPRRGRLHRILGREDIRHLLKHKRTYCAAHLTARERRILDNPSGVSWLYSRTVKPLYLFVTRRLLHWADREGAADRSISQ